MKTPLLAAWITALCPLPLLAAALPGPVVDAQWLKANAAEVTVIDVRDDLDSWTTAPEFEKDPKTGQERLVATGGHLDGALPLLFKKVRVDVVRGQTKLEKMLPDRAAWQELMQASGVPRDRPIVITSPGESPDQVEEAARVYWSLKTYGATQLALLDGGNAAWIAAGFPISTVKTDASRGNWEATAEHPEWNATAQDVSQAVRQKSQIVDARPVSQYLGLAVRKPLVTAGGHLEGALNYPTELRFRTVGIAQMFLTPGEYRAAMRAQSIDPAAASITYCNTGHMAAGLWFVQSEVLGVSGVRLYDGSMHEWTTTGRPVVGLGG